jgi:hypothetical protein
MKAKQFQVSKALVNRATGTCTDAFRFRVTLCRANRKTVVMVLGSSSGAFHRVNTVKELREFLRSNCVEKIGKVVTL